MIEEIYTLILRLLPEWLLILLATISGIGYLWRGLHVPLFPPPGWVLIVRAIVLLSLVVPFYLIIASGEPNIIQARAMSRVIFFSLIISQILGHVQVALVVKRGYR